MICLIILDVPRLTYHLFSVYECSIISLEGYMYCRFATQEDRKKILCAIVNKKIDYITAAHIKADFEKNLIVVCVDKNKILGSLTLVWSDEYGCYFIKRLCVYNNKNKNKGIASFLFSFIININCSFGCTPWVDNKPMEYLMRKYNFELKYIFNENWCFYFRQSEST